MTVQVPGAQKEEQPDGRTGSVVNAYISIFTYHPCKCFWPCLLLQLFLGFMAVPLKCLEINQRQGAWWVYADEHTQHFKAWDDLEDMVDAKRRLEQHGSAEAMAWNYGEDADFWSGDAEDFLPVSTHRGGSPWQRPSYARRLQEEDDDERRIIFFYKTNMDGTGNIFTPESIAGMCELEKRVLTKYGTLMYHSTPVSTFYGSDYNSWSCEPLSQAFVNSKVAMFNASVRVEGAQSPYSQFVHPSFMTTGVTSYTKSTILKEMNDDDFDEWLKEIYEPMGLSYGFLKSPFQGDEDRFISYKGMRLRMVSFDINEQNMLAMDFLMAFGAFIFVYLVMYVYLRSFWLASWAMFQIVMTIPIGALIYKMLFQVQYFSFLHVLVVYLVLGIGADDIFVLCDSFRHIAEEHNMQPDKRFAEADFHRVMSQTFWRTASAILNTSFTTAVAFLSSSVSKVMPMRTMGQFAAICIILCYFTTITFAPASLAIYHYYFQGKRCCCPPCTKRQRAAIEARGNDEEGPKRRGCVSFVLERFYIPVMSMKVGPLRVFALLAVLIMGATAGQGIYFTSQLTPPSKPEEWFPDNHMITDLDKFQSENYLSPDYDKFVELVVYWGVDKLDVDKMDTYNPQDFKDGVVFDGAFDPTTKEAQDHIKLVCEQLRTVTCHEEACKNKPYGTLMMQTSYKSHSCFLEDFEQWKGGPIYGPAFVDELKTFRSTVNESAYSSPALEAEYGLRIGVVGGALKFVAVAIRTTISTLEPYSTGMDVRDLVDKQMEEWRAQAPAGMKSIKYSGGFTFAEYDLGDELKNGFFQGCAISIPVAAIVLLGSTRNFVVTLYALASLGFIVTSVLGFCKSAMDWDLGIGEAVAGVIVIGYSVDYVVHLGHIYCEAKLYGISTRGERAEFAIRNMGSTIFAGALTTAGSGAIMFICFFSFFSKMATLITVTIMYSFLYALLMLMGLLWLIGPEGDFGDLCCSFAKRKPHTKAVEDVEAK